MSRNCSARSTSTSWLKLPSLSMARSYDNHWLWYKFVWGWGVMEPITFLIGVSDMIIAYIFWMRTTKSYGYDNVLSVAVNKRLDKELEEVISRYHCDRPSTTRMSWVTCRGWLSTWNSNRCSTPPVSMRCWVSSRERLMVSKSNSKRMTKMQIERLTVFVFKFIALVFYLSFFLIYDKSQYFTFNIY